MKLSAIAIAAVLLGMLPAQGHAAVGDTGLSALDTISTLRVDSASGYNAVTSSALHNCGGNWKRSYLLPTTVPNAAEIFKLLTASMLAGRKVVINWKCDSANRAQIVSVSSGPD